MRTSSFPSLSSFRSLALPVLVLFQTVYLARAQSQATIQACSASLNEPTYQDTYTLSGSDTTYWSFVYTWDYTSCGTVPVAGVWLYDDDSGTRYTCTFTQFVSSGTMTSVCQITNGGMVATGDGDWYMYLKYGVKPTFYTREDDFDIVAAVVTSSSTAATSTLATSTTAAATATTTATVASGAAVKRRKVEQAGLAVPTGFECPDRQRACPAGRKGVWKCMDIWTGLNSCGGCPMTSESQDCGDIAGASHVQCIMGQCTVNSCDRHHYLSQNGTACLNK